MIGERLTELRIKNNMTQEEFAEYMSVTRQSVSKWETDKTYPDVEKMIRIAQLYNVSLDYLIKGQENEPVKELAEDEHIEEEHTHKVSIDATEEIEINAQKEVEIDRSETENDVQENDEEINSPITKSKGLKICLGISTIFCILSLAFIIMFLVQNPWFHSDIKEQSVKVDDVYSQLSMAQVSYETEKGDTVTEVVLLDLENVGQGDSISIYASGNGNLFVDYGAGLLTAVIVFFVINLGAAILLVKEISRL